MRPSRLVTTMLVNPMTPPCVLHVACTTRRLGLGRRGVWGTSITATTVAYRLRGEAKALTGVSVESSQ